MKEKPKPSYISQQNTLSPSVKVRIAQLRAEAEYEGKSFGTPLIDDARDCPIILSHYKGHQSQFPSDEELIRALLNSSD